MRNLKILTSVEIFCFYPPVEFLKKCGYSNMFSGVGCSAFEVMFLSHQPLSLENRKQYWDTLHVFP